MVWLLPLKHKNSVSWRIRTREVPDSGTPKSPKAEVNVAYDHEQYEWRDISTSFLLPSYRTNLRHQTYSSPNSHKEVMGQVSEGHFTEET